MIKYYYNEFGQFVYKHIDTDVYEVCRECQETFKYGDYCGWCNHFYCPACCSAVYARNHKEEQEEW